MPEALTPFDANGYGQMHESTAKELAIENNDQFDSSELTTVYGSVKYSQRKIAQAIKIYASDDVPMDTETKKIVAITYNSGLLTPRNAALQNQLKDLGHIDKTIGSTGNVGDNTLNGFKDFADQNNIQISKTEIKDLFDLKNKEQFEQSELYVKLKTKWKNDYNSDPKYAQLPQYSTNAYGGVVSTTSSGYANEVVNFADSTCYSGVEFIC